MGSARALKGRLCAMMFMEYAVRGMWYPYLASYLAAPREVRGLGFSTGQVGWVLGFANALGAITAPVVAGQVADRYFNAERALGALHIVAAVLLFLNAGSTSFWPFFWWMLLFSVAYVPTQSLTNSLALTHLTEKEREYPRVRMWGTIGWVVTSALFTYVVLASPERAVNVARIPYALRAAACLAVGYAMFAMFGLPKTPPVREEARPARGAAKHRRAEALGLAKEGTRWAVGEALGLLRNRSVLVLMLVAMPVAAIHTAYYLNIGPYLTGVVGVPERWLGPTIAVSQTSEVAFLFGLGPILRRWGYKRVLVVGAGAQAVRFAVFAAEPPGWVVIVALSLHGVAFACFFTTAILYIERVSRAGIRHSAQTVFGIVLFGLGPALAGPYSQVFDWFRGAGGRADFRVIWGVQCAVAVGTAVALLVGFRDGGWGVKEEEVVVAEAGEVE